MGNYAASEAPWLVDALLGRLEGAKAGATVDVSETYSAAYAVSAVKAHRVALARGSRRQRPSWAPCWGSAAQLPLIS